VTSSCALLLTACHTKHACAKFGVIDWRTYRTDKAVVLLANDCESVAWESPIYAVGTRAIQTGNRIVTTITYLVGAD
jgi:hypothetical protein